MMFHAQGPARNNCSMLAVFCGKIPAKKQQRSISDDKTTYPFPELASSGRLEVQILTNPSIDEFRRVLESSEPNIVYLQGEQITDSEEIGSLRWGDCALTTSEAICELFGSTLPSTVYLEIPNGEMLAEALRSKGVPYVIYWKNGISCYEACHFRQALVSVVQSSCSHTWDAFQLAHASFKIYCIQNNNILPSSSQKTDGKSGPYVSGDPPKIDIGPLEEDLEGEESSPGTLPAIKIYDEDVSMRFLVCGMPCTLDAFLLGSLEYGLNALLNIEIRGSKLHNRTSAPPPPLQAGTFSRGVVTMRCDVSTCSSAHISLLVSGSAQTCFNDQLLENHIKNELIEKSQLVHAIPSSDGVKLPSSEPRKSASIACGASVFEVRMKVPTWASQVLRQLAQDVSYRSLVMLGIASIQGLSVASFEKDDAERLLYFCTRQGKKFHANNSFLSKPPSWWMPPAPCRKRSEPCQVAKPLNGRGLEGQNGGNVRQKLNVAALRPIPHTRGHKMLPFSGFGEGERYDGDQVKVNLPVAPTKHVPAPVTHRKSLSSSFQAQQIISLNPLPLKKHGCGRAPIQACSEEEFLRDVMQFLVLRGHTRLVPQGGLAEFPDAILNAKRLDLFNLYREVVSRGGFHVGNGINWKGQVFSKMRNHTLTNRMTGVGNTLKRHYETYLLEYELAHDDVDGECCLLCHSSAAGDWVNCGICGEWAHFGCDRRQGLGAFKDYAKTDGLEYICPHCSISNFKKKSQRTANGYS
ncbi:AT-rich interactive domain-containing protein 4 [Tripterygium wilfordii]|uniref:AT-rich interactive domain-containing protein 4 n=1 Tax=Tripterygium wilfordii TaxID=458696 RepID=A0A7J7D9T4_TRIWF|nr:AT-rich interactive domain-containing protein 4 [Tripterygium wilfordii]XP_038711607.1 AT-rich interactive domain-containing protein 4 [Tripterygium wilfordii]KAF5743130.1 AT-rich interactive domain-containing protein 4 [Tripterygium wilfordii]